MKRSLGASAVLVLLAALGGCSICESPFDYCGPVKTDNGCQSCNFGARRGSLFAPVDGIPATTPVAANPTTPPPSPAERRDDYEAPSPTPEPRTAALDGDERIE